MSPCTSGRIIPGFSAVLSSWPSWWLLQLKNRSPWRTSPSWCKFNTQPTWLYVIFFFLFSSWKGFLKGPHVPYMEAIKKSHDDGATENSERILPGVHEGVAEKNLKVLYTWRIISKGEKLVAWIWQEFFATSDVSFLTQLVYIKFCLKTNMSSLFRFYFILFFGFLNILDHFLVSSEKFGLYCLRSVYFWLL